MRRHRVPDGTRIQLGQSELQLAGTLLQHIVHDELVDSTVVGLLYSSHRSPDGSLQRAATTVEGDPLGLVVLMGGSRVQIELGWILRILRTELHFLVHVVVFADMTTSDVESLLG